MSKRQAKKRAVIFDFDGTLADSFGVMVEAYQTQIRRYKLRPIAKSDLPKLQKMNYRELFKYTRAHWYKMPFLMPAIVREFTKRRQEIQLFKGIPKLLNDLQDRGLIVGVLTSNSQENVSEVLEREDANDLNFIVSEKRLFRKDKAFKNIEKTQKIKPSEILYIGDEPRDVVACRRAGVAVVGVTWGLGGEPGMKREPPDFIAYSVAELKKIIFTQTND